MQTSNSKAYLFESAPIYKAFFTLALPSVFGKIIMLVYNLADTWFIAYTDNADLVAGVSLVFPVFMILIALGDIFGVGGSSVVSRLLGKQQKEDVRRVSALCFYGSIILGCLLAILLLLLEKPFLTILGADSSTYSYASDYYTYIALGAPLILTANIPLNILRTEGMSTASMIGSITGSVVNIILDPIFIFGLNMGAAGAAIATVIGNVAALLVYACFYHYAEWVTISLKYLHFNWEDLKNILAVGIPAALNNLMNSFAMALTNRFLLPFGNDKIAAWNLAGKSSMICTMLLVSFSFSSLPLIGYNYGNENHQRLRKILKFIYTFEIGLAATFTVILGLAAPYMIAFFMDDTAIISTGAEILRCQVLGMVFNAILLISLCTFQAMGNGKATLLVTLSRQGIIFVPVIILLSHYLGYQGILFTQPISDFITATITLFILFRNLKKES